MYRFAAALAVLASFSLPALANGSCPDNPDAIGTSRTITVDPQALPHIGTMQYRQSLPLDDHEVVITFDDGPLPPYTDRILDILAKNCVKADYFLVGQMASAYPAAVRRIYEAGHVIGTHSLHHPLTFRRLGRAALAREVDGGIAAVEAALGDPRALAPFFRIPGLLRSSEADGYLAGKQLATFSADEVADDWHHGITPKEIVMLAMRRIAAKGHRGVLLLHDIHPATVAALPLLLKQLKENGYKIVQAVPAGERIALPPRERPAKLASAGPLSVLPQTDPRASGEASGKRAAHHARHRKAHADADAIAPATVHEETSHTASSGFLWPKFFTQ